MKTEKKTKQTNDNLQQTDIFTTTTKKEHYKVKKQTNKQTKEDKTNEQANVINAPFGSEKKNPYRHHAGQKQYTGGYKGSTLSCLACRLAFVGRNYAFFR